MPTPSAEFNEAAMCRYLACSTAPQYAQWVQDFAAAAARWWNFLLDMSPPDSGSWPTAIAPRYNTEGELQSISLSDDGIGWAHLHINITDDENIVQVKGEIKAGHGEGNFTTMDLLPLREDNAGE